MSRSMKIPSVFFFFFLFVREEKFVKFNNRDISVIFTIFFSCIELFFSRSSSCNRIRANIKRRHFV